MFKDPEKNLVGNAEVESSVKCGGLDHQMRIFVQILLVPPKES